MANDAGPTDGQRDHGEAESGRDGDDSGTDDSAAGRSESETAVGVESADIPSDVRSYDKFSKIDGGTYDRANDFLRERTYITAREWAIARLCADFRTETGVEMTKIGENLPHLVPFMTDTYSPQAVNQGAGPPSRRRFGKPAQPSFTARCVTSSLPRNSTT